MKKKLLVCLLTVCMVVTMVPFVAFADYADTNGHWAEDAISTWTANGVLEGNGDGTFNPNGTMTRAEAAALFAKLLKLEGAADISMFTDVEADAWYAEAIAKCVAAGIMNGVGADSMDPNGTLTREQMFVMFARALNIEPIESTDKEFNDAHEVSDWAEGYVNALVEAGYVKGTASGELEPAVEINRASVVALIDQTIEVYADEEGEKVEATGTGIVLVVADKVEVTAPAGSQIATAPKVEEVKANDVVLEADDLHEVPAAPVTPVTPVVPTPPAEEEEAHSHSYVVPEGASCAAGFTKTCACGAPVVVAAGLHTWADGACSVCGITAAEALKFNLSVEGGENGTGMVAVTVYDDYSLVLNLKAEEVDASSVTVGVKMQNVGSLGVDGPRSESITLNTGLTNTPDLATWLDATAGFEDAKLVIDIKGLPCVYTLSGSVDGTNTTILGVPADVEETRAAWHELMKAVDTESGLAHDTNIVLAAGTALVAGNETLTVDEDLVLDGLTANGALNSLEQQIRDNVSLNQNTPFEGSKLIIAEGTTLQVSSSKAWANTDVTITTDFEVADETLTGLKGASGMYDILSALVGLVDDVVEAVDNMETVTISIDFTVAE